MISAVLLKSINLQYLIMNSHHLLVIDPSPKSKKIKRIPQIFRDYLQLAAKYSRFLYSMLK